MNRIFISTLSVFCLVILACGCESESERADRARLQKVLTEAREGAEESAELMVRIQGARNEIAAKKLRAQIEGAQSPPDFPELQVQLVQLEQKLFQRSSETADLMRERKFLYEKLGMKEPPNLKEQRERWKVDAPK